MIRYLIEVIRSELIRSRIKEVFLAWRHTVTRHLRNGARVCMSSQYDRAAVTGGDNYIFRLRAKEVTGENCTQVRL